jgi:hypothetical protein
VESTPTLLIFLLKFFFVLNSLSPWSPHGQVGDCKVQLVSKIWWEIMMSNAESCVSLLIEIPQILNQDKAPANFARHRAVTQMLNGWNSLFQSKEYIGSNFLTLYQRKDTPLIPTHVKSGPWMCKFGRSHSLTALPGGQLMARYNATTGFGRVIFDKAA